ncbi:hypothetical protein [Photobacterium satsumensis]|uniref:hypothetical protein n=1 Tax=Photobacterium satsumensis TaxID=2910239 RepID=UPI003D13A2AE
MLDINMYSKYIVALEPIINGSRKISGYEVCLKTINDSTVMPNVFDHETKLNKAIYMLDRLTYFVESNIDKKCFSEISFYVTFEFDYIQEPRVLIFVHVLNNVLKSKGSSLVFIFHDNDLSKNVNLIYSYDFYYPTSCPIKLGVMCFDFTSFHQLDVMNKFDISVVKFKFDLRLTEILITQVIPICSNTNSLLLFEDVNDEGLFFEASGISNALYKGCIAGSVIYIT